jgi:hypothetical protein
MHAALPHHHFSGVNNLMDLGSTFLALALLILIGMFITRPFFETQSLPKPEKSGKEEAQEHQRSALLAERDRLLTALQELDFDNTLGKIPEEEFPQQRQNLMLQGVDVLKKLDELQGQTNDERANARSIDERLEAVIAARKAEGARSMAQAEVFQPARNAASEPVSIDDEVEKLISIRRQSRKELSSGFCPKCGKPVQKSDIFCPKCGTKQSEPSR